MVASCILDQHEQTASHAEFCIENCHRMHTRHKHTTSALHNETLIFHIHKHLQLHASQYRQKHNIHHIPYTNIQHTSTLQAKHYLLPWPLHNKHSHYNRHQNKLAPYIYIYCLYAYSHNRQLQHTARTSTTHSQF